MLSSQYNPDVYIERCTCPVLDLFRLKTAVLDTLRLAWDRRKCLQLITDMRCMFCPDFRGVVYMIKQVMHVRHSFFKGVYLHYFLGS